MDLSSLDQFVIKDEDTRPVWIGFGSSASLGNPNQGCFPIGKFDRNSILEIEGKQLGKPNTAVGQKVKAKDRLSAKVATNFGAPVDSNFTKEKQALYEDAHDMLCFYGNNLEEKYIEETATHIANTNVKLFIRHAKPTQGERTPGMLSILV